MAEVIARSDRIAVSRRSFLSRAGLAGVGSGLSFVRLDAADISRYLSPSSFPKRATWHHSYGKALADAKKAAKPILLLFTGEEWSRASKLLQRKVFMKSEFHEWAIRSVVLAKVELSRDFKPTVFNIFERKKHEALITKYRVRTIPSAIFLSPGEIPLGILRFSGQTAREYVAAAQRILKRRQTGPGDN